MDFDRMPYTEQVDHLTDWTMKRIEDLADDDRRPPLVVPVTVTFVPCAVRPSRVLVEFERLYLRICRLLMCNPERPSKRRLLPLVLAFRDEAHTRPDKHPCDRDRDFFNQPAVAPHVHSIMVVHPDLADRFVEIAGDLENVWRSIPQRGGGLPRYDNGSLRIEMEFVHRVRALMAADPVGYRARVRGEVRSWIDYSAKLMRRRSADDDGDVFTALPSETGSPLTGRPALGGRNRVGV